MHFNYVNDGVQEILDEERIYEHLRVTCGDDIPIDADLIGLYLDAAIDYCETKTGVPLRTKTVKMSYDTPTDAYGWILRFPTNVTDVESITYRDSDGVLQTFDKTKTFINNIRIPNIVVFNESLPSSANNIIITYKVTAVTNPMAPAGIASAALLLVGHFYQKREISGDPKFMITIDNILNPYKLKWHH